MSARAFEQRVWEVEKIRLVLRCPDAVTVEPYPYQRAAPNDWTVAEWLENRVRPIIGDIQADVVGPDFASVRGNTRLETLRT